MRQICAADRILFLLPAGTLSHDAPLRLPGSNATRLTGQNRSHAMKAVHVTLLVIGTMSARNPGLAADAAYGEYLAAECVACHGADADGAIPALQTLRDDELIAALKAYRAGTRTNPVMQNVARSLDDAAIEALAVYFSGQP
jgi:cytochrome c